jgi:hypothetical protein
MNTSENEELWRRDLRRFETPRRVRPHEGPAAPDPVRTIAIAVLALLAALAFVAFAPAAWGAEVARAIPALQPAPVAPASQSAAPRYALVMQDAVPLRATPRASGAPLAQLGQGELLELRGVRMDYLQVYDTRRERGGFVRASALRPLSLEAGEAPELLALLRFLRDRPGMEALGLGVAAAYLKAAPAGAITAEPFDAMGTMAERLAWRANVAGAQAAANTKRGETPVSAQLEVAASLGVHFDSVERDGAVLLCYDGEAFRHVLVLSPTPSQAARAALALTRPDCVATDLSPLVRWQRDQADARLLERVDSATGLAPYERNRLRLRRAGVWSAIAFEDSRRLAVEAAAAPDGLPTVGPADVQRAGENALAALAGVDKSELADDDQAAYAEAAMRVGASRWAAEPAPAARVPAGLSVVLQPGQPGETCVLLVDAKHGVASPLARRCTYGTVWPASARANSGQTSLALAVQPLATWRELWVFRQAPEGWTVQVLPPAADAGGIGYIEFAGWVPATGQVLAAREVRDAVRAGPSTRSFELLDAQTLATTRRAEWPDALSTFLRWQDPQWKRVTVSLR